MIGEILYRAGLKKQTSSSDGAPPTVQKTLTSRPTMDVQTATAITTSLVAVIVAIITWRQWDTNRARLKHELFDRRYKIYEKTASFLSKIGLIGRVAPGEELQFLRDTKRAFFVFGCDTAVQKLVSDIYKRAVDLHALEVELDGLIGNERSSNIQKQREIKDWFQSTLGSLENDFEKYLKLDY